MKQAVRFLSDIKEDWESFFAAYFDYFKIKAIWFFSWFEKVKKTIANVLYRQRGKFAQPLAHFWMGGFLILGIMFSPVIEEKIKGKTLNWESVPAGNSVIASAGDFYNTSTLASSGTRGDVVEYVVREGDTLSSVAKKFGLSLDTLIWANDLSAKSPIKTGQKLKIPPIDGIVHAVKRGETVYSIAKRYEANPQEIVDFPFNTFANDETFALDINQTLVVPNGIMPKAEPVISRPQYVADVSQGAGTGSFIWPATGKITQRFSWYHPAVDIANKDAPPIASAMSGTVVSAIYSRWGYGNHVIVDHGNGYKTLYAHMSSLSVSAGTRVAQGQVIGQMGSTGRSTGTHLHFEIIKDGVKLDPLTMLK